MKSLIEVKGLHKYYPDQSSGSQRIGGLLNALRGRTAENATAVLKHVDLHVDPGECVGLIGENGAGKSTLLKVISGVLQPTRGKLQVNGSIAALLELGAGFHPEFSGRENIRLTAQLMGISNGQLQHCYQQIIDFADIGHFIDAPVKHYSSGMVVRLGFAIVSVLKPDLLITDEVLAVGDIAFQKKCMNWVEDYIADGGAVLLVSHSMDQVVRLCQRVYWIHKGHIEQEGPARNVVNAYLAYHDAKMKAPDPDYKGGLYRIVGMSVNEQIDPPGPVIIDDHQLIVDCIIHSPDDRPPVVAIGIRDAAGAAVYGTTSEIDGAEPARIGDHRYWFRLQFDTSPLQPGPYRIAGHAMDPEGLRLFDTVVREFTLFGEKQRPGFWNNPLSVIDDQSPADA